MGTPARLFASFLALLLTVSPLAAEELAGVWLSPDWFFPGTRNYTEAEVRSRARAVMENLQEQGCTAVFLETFLRGYSIAPAISRENYKAAVIPYERGGQGIPVYPHLRWNYRVEADVVIDPLQIFIEEGSLAGIEVHAWAHMFYWRMDNTEVMLPWHNGPSVWNELMEQYLREQATALKDKPGAAPDTVAMMLEAAELFARSSEGRELEEILTRHGLDPEGRPMGIMLRQALRAGAEKPDFLLISSLEDPFPAPRGKRLRPIYVNPASPQVQRILVRVIGQLLEGHPDLAGVHLDHVRYPVDGQGFPERLGIVDGSYRYFEPTDPAQLQTYRDIHEHLAERRQGLKALIEEIAGLLGKHQKLSAAVIPLYYRDRDQGNFRICGYDFACQAWYDWPVSFVVPMMYEFHPYLIRNLVKLYEEQQRAASDTAIDIYPGISRLQVGRTGLGENRSWVFFDLTLARDVKLEREEPEDFDFGPD